MKTHRALYPCKDLSAYPAQELLQPTITWNINFLDKTPEVEHILNSLSEYSSTVESDIEEDVDSFGSIQSKRTSPYSISLIRKPKVFLTKNNEPCIDICRGEGLISDFASTYTEAFTPKKPFTLGYSLKHVKGYRLIFSPRGGKLFSERKIPSAKYEMKPKIFDGRSVKHIYSIDNYLGKLGFDPPKQSFADWVTRGIEIRASEHGLIHRLNAKIMQEALPWITGSRWPAKRPLKRSMVRWVSVYRAMYQRGGSGVLYNYLDGTMPE